MFCKNRFGKPFINNSGLFFNLSHSRNSFLIGINTIGRIGVDIEADMPDDTDTIADFSFSENERELFRRNPENFLKIWTQKEAFLKAAGTGLLQNLSCIDSITSIPKFGMKCITFTCPDTETASIVFRATEIPEFACHFDENDSGLFC